MQDYYNLVDVYLDAVLHPNCVRDEKTFAQEGWHFELEKPEVRRYLVTYMGKHAYGSHHPAR